MHNNFKKITIIIEIVLLSSFLVFSKSNNSEGKRNRLNAPPTKLGVKVGPNITHAYSCQGFLYKSFTSKFAASASIYFEQPFNKYFSLQPEIMVLMKSVKFSLFNGESDRSRQKYIEIPLLVKFILSEGAVKFFFLTGPAFASCPGSWGTHTDFTLHFGIGLALKTKFGEVNLEPRYIVGFLEDNLPDISAKYGVISIMIGCGYNLTKNR